MVFSFTQPRVGLLLAFALAGPGMALAQSGAPSAQALEYFKAQSLRQGLHDGDASNPSVTSSYFDQSSGLTHTYLRQRVNGLDIIGSVGNVHTDRTGKPVLMHQGFLTDAAKRAPSPTPTLTAAQAVSAAAVGLQLPRPVGLTLVKEARPADGLVFNNGGISEYDIPVRLMYAYVDGQLKLVWDVTIAQLDQQHYWLARVDAHTGKVVDKHDTVINEEITFQHLTARALSGKAGATSTPTPAPQPANRGTLGGPNTLTVWPVPLESPDKGPRVAVPFSSINPTYSPYGWQVADPRAPAGAFPASYSRLSAGVYLTRGNNVAAYDDSPNAVGANTSGNLGSNINSPDGGAALNFDFPFNQPLGPKYGEPASITNLFYWNNMLHDVLMSKGFDEAAGNFQYRNITPQGAPGDFVRAEAHDGGGRNNANFTPTADGIPGRMQMYLFDGRGGTTLTISSPAALAGTFTVTKASFGGDLTKYLPSLCGNLVAVNDGYSGNGGLHGCVSPYANASAVNGKIALIMRGGCSQLPNGVRTNSSFNGKVRRAQENGAIMAIVIDSLASSTTPVIMGGTDTVGIRIPAVFMNGADGDRLRQVLQAANAPVVAGCVSAPQDYDGAVDNNVVGHEYAHGVTNRLTGGPAVTGCLTTTAGTTPYQTMGEGWSDFVGMWMTTRTGDVGRTLRYTGEYLMGAPGFRNKPYTDDIALNNYTYGILNTTAYHETHNVGEVWATVLWDLNWQFIYRYGFNPDFLAQTGGNNQFMKLVLQGCKLQVCNPGFLDGRDALLRADSLLNGGANSGLIWTMFARRGMGFSAVQGTRDVVSGYPSGLPSFNGIAEAFNLPGGIRPATILNPAVAPLSSQSASVINGSLVSAYPNPAQDELTIQSQLSSKSAVQVSLVNLVGQTVVNTTATVAEVQRGLKLNTSALAQGLYVVRVSTSEGTFTTKVQVRH